MTRDMVPVIHHDWAVKLPGPAAIRVPVTHLTLQQFLSLPPQVMTNGPDTDETTIARAADAAAMTRLMLASGHDMKRVRQLHAHQRASAAGAGSASTITGGAGMTSASPLSSPSTGDASGGSQTAALLPSPGSTSDASSPPVPAAALALTAAGVPGAALVPFDASVAATATAAVISPASAATGTTRTQMHNPLASPASAATGAGAAGPLSPTKRRAFAQLPPPLASPDALTRPQGHTIYAHNPGKNVPLLAPSRLARTSSGGSGSSATGGDILGSGAALSSLATSSSSSLVSLASASAVAVTGAAAVGTYGYSEFAANARRADALGLHTDGVPPHVLALSFAQGLRDRFTTLEQVLRFLPPGTGANIEVKYPTPSETAMLGLRFPEQNLFVERILDVVFAVGGGRRIMFSSFDADICLLLARKQAAHPVFFLTEAGTPDAPLADERMNSLAAAVSFASDAGLFGVVTEVSPLLACPSIITNVQCDAGLVLCTYGRRNNDPEVVRLQQRYGVGAIIVDHVAHVARTLRSRVKA